MVRRNQDVYEQVRELLPRLSQHEKAHLLHEVARELDNYFPGIESHRDVCGGDACIIRTRIPVWVLEGMRRRGASDEQLLQAYPTLDSDDLTNAFHYAKFHQDEIEQQIRENEAA